MYSNCACPKPACVLEMVEVSGQSDKVRETEKKCTLFLQRKLMPVDFGPNVYEVQRLQRVCCLCGLSLQS